MFPTEGVFLWAFRDSSVTSKLADSKVSVRPF